MVVNVRRLPGILYQHRIRVLVLCTTLLSVYVLIQTGVICTSHHVDVAIQNLCEEFRSGRAAGSLCAPLCSDGAVSTVACTPLHAGKHLVFSAKWDEQMIIIKSAYPANNRKNQTSQLPHVDEEEFKRIVQDIITNKLNVTVSTKQLERLTRLDSRKEAPAGSPLRRQEQIDAYTLLQSQEYLLSLLFSDRDLFPQVLGTCGHLYAAEYLQEPKINSFFVEDDQEVWSERMKLAISIMDLLEELETNFPDLLHLCDVKMAHFGMTPLGRLKYIDLDLVYTDNVLQRMASAGQVCNGDNDCDIFDCKAACNDDTKKCDSGISNNNLQTVCEKIFIGWTLSGKMLVPGLLMSDRTPASLSALLRQCADNGRSAVPEDIRQRLYTTLTEMHQILTQKLFS